MVGQRKVWVNITTKQVVIILSSINIILVIYNLFLYEFSLNCGTAFNSIKRKLLLYVNKISKVPEGKSICRPMSLGSSSRLNIFWLKQER